MTVGTGAPGCRTFPLDPRLHCGLSRGGEPGLLPRAGVLEVQGAPLLRFQHLLEDPSLLLDIGADGLRAGDLAPDRGLLLR